VCVEGLPLKAALCHLYRPYYYHYFYYLLTVKKGCCKLEGKYIPNLRGVGQLLALPASSPLVSKSRLTVLSLVTIRFATSY